MSTIQIFSQELSQQFDLSQNLFPSEVNVFTNGDQTYKSIAGSLFGYIFNGTVNVETEKGDSYLLKEGMYFNVPRDLRLSGLGKALVINSRKSPGLFQFGGPIEASGRLAYIDGCTTTLLISPPKLGEPCLNALYFPPKILQSLHKHPSYRIGVVSSGDGFAITNESKTILKKNAVFLIPENLEHCFQSGENGLSVIAYHPDSDWGPTDEVHPMINRTILS